MSDPGNASTPAVEAPATAAPKKSRVVAGLLSLVAPGLGHVYVGRSARGLAWAVVPFALLFGYALVRELGAVAMALVVLLGLGARVGAVLDAVLLVSSARAVTLSRLRWLAFGLALFVGDRLEGALLRAFAMEAFTIPSGSMEPSVRVGDHFFVDKAAFLRRDPRRGEVIVFEDPEHPGRRFVKRVVAQGGDVVMVKAGRLSINGWEVPRCEVGRFAYDAGREGSLAVEFLQGTAYLTLNDPALMREDQGPFTVDEGGFFVLGDNRDNSYDSRMWFGGAGGSLPRAKVVGPARLVWLSSSRDGLDFTRAGLDLAGRPVAPTPETRGALEACLAKAPPLAAQTPPPPR